MPLDFTNTELTELKPRISVIGVGGAGGNAVNNMIRAELQGIDFVVANTDAQALTSSLAETRLQLGLKITQGLGAGSIPDRGRAAAEEAQEHLEAQLEGVHMCFITAGMGGGTGTGAAPVIARMARERGILTVGVVTKPFGFEGAKRMRQAEEGIAELQKHVDTLIIIPNQNLFRIATPDTTFQKAFAMADEVLHAGVRGITDLMMVEGLINLDFADVRTVMSEMGKAMMGTGEAEGANRAIEAAQAAINNPLLDEVSLRGAKGVIINITGGLDLTLFEVDEAANHIREQVDPDANVIFGSAFSETLNGRMRVSVVATGIDAASASLHTPQRSSSQVFGGGVGSFHASSQRPAAPVAAKAALTGIAAGMPAPLPEEDVLSLDTLAEPEPVAEAPAPIAEPVMEAAPMVEPEPIVAPVAAAPEPIAPPAPRIEEQDNGKGMSLFQLMTSTFRAAPKQRVTVPPQPELPAIDTAARADDDDLTIPDFLRKQAN
jgi:cell division protein FtsZ